MLKKGNTYHLDPGRKLCYYRGKWELLVKTDKGWSWEMDIFEGKEWTFYVAEALMYRVETTIADDPGSYSNTAYLYQDMVDHMPTIVPILGWTDFARLEMVHGLTQVVITPFKD